MAVYSLESILQQCKLQTKGKKKREKENKTNDIEKLPGQTFLSVLFKICQALSNAEVYESVTASVIKQSRPRS